MWTHVTLLRLFAVCDSTGNPSQPLGLTLLQELVGFPRLFTAFLVDVVWGFAVSRLVWRQVVIRLLMASAWFFPLRLGRFGSRLRTSRRGCRRRSAGCRGSRWLGCWPGRTVMRISLCGSSSRSRSQSLSAGACLHVESIVAGRLGLGLRFSERTILIRPASPAGQCLWAGVRRCYG